MTIVQLYRAAIRVAPWVVALVLMSCGDALQAQPPPIVGQSGKQASPAPADSKEKLRFAHEAYLDGRFQDALRVIGDLLRQAPEDSAALNLQGLCYVKLENYSAAIDSFRRGLNAHPDDAYDVAGLLTAYSLSGKAFEAGEQREKLQQLQAAGRLPAKFSFLIDKFQLNGQNVEVYEFFPPTADKFHYRYSFRISKDGQLAYRIALESDDGDQVFLSQNDPQRAEAMAAAGKRRYSLDKYGPNTHATFKFYDGEPSYEAVREDAKQAIIGALRPMLSQTYPSPAASPPGPAGSVAPSQPSTPAAK